MDERYETQFLTPEYHKIFTGIYNDFTSSAYDVYKFEVPPLDYKSFLASVERNLINCIILLENKIPVAFLVYTTVTTEAIELNLIHCLGNEDVSTKRKMLIEEFLKQTQYMGKVVCYPMVGPQGDFIAELATYGFKFVGQAVLRFWFDKNFDCLKILNNAELREIAPEYELVSWNNDYKEHVVTIVQQAFENTADAEFDPRFKTLDGVRDIIEKIVDGTYGEFLPDTATILLHNGGVCGCCLTNITDGKIANIPIFAIAKDHQGKGIAKHLLKRSISLLAEKNERGEREFAEINTTTETDNYPALNMYRGIGFKEDYCYPQSYLPVK
ncbi:GNAT family N-acetyltransferase [bacterium]|nr:GNAT family N-acetyltransferase [bacterium]